MWFQLLKTSIRRIDPVLTKVIIQCCAWQNLVLFRSLLHTVISSQILCVRKRALLRSLSSTADPCVSISMHISLNFPVLPAPIASNCMCLLDCLNTSCNSWGPMPGEAPDGSIHLRNCKAGKGNHLSRLTCGATIPLAQASASPPGFQAELLMAACHPNRCCLVLAHVTPAHTRSRSLVL
jgi:hypothetical protein